MENKDKKQLIHLLNKLRNEYCEHYNCCFNKDKGYHYDEPNLCPLCYGGPSHCICEDLVSWALGIRLTEERHPRIYGRTL